MRPATLALLSLPFLALTISAFALVLLGYGSVQRKRMSSDVVAGILEPTPTSRPALTATPVPTLSPPPGATPIPTIAAPSTGGGPGPQAIRYGIELDAPIQIGQHDSDYLRLAITVSEDEIVVIENSSQGRVVVTSKIKAGAYHRLEAATAQLVAPAFDVSATNSERQLLITGAPEWRWLLVPKQSGRQTVYVSLTFEWRVSPVVSGGDPRVGPEPPGRWFQQVSIRVAGDPFFSKGSLNIGAITGAFLTSLMSAPFLVSTWQEWRKPKQASGGDGGAKETA